jgi:protein O-mannosyl-transferase
LADKNKNKDVNKSMTLKPAVVKKHSNSFLVLSCIAIITIVTYFVFSPSLQNDFTNWDDPDYVLHNPLVVNNSVPVIKIFEQPVSLHYQPLTVLSLALNYQYGKLDPFGYHLENVILHLLNTILVFLFIFLLTRRNLLMAVIVSLFFGIHPMHVESVSWISERKDVLYVFFFLAGLITYLRYSESKKTTWYFFTLLFFILSCLSKEMAIVFPAILLLIDYLKGVKWNKKIFIEKIPFFFLAIIVGVIEIKIQSGNAGYNVKNFSAFHRLLFASYASIIYIAKLFVPYKLSAFYPYPDAIIRKGIPLIYYFSPFILIGMLGVLFYFFLKKEKAIVFGLLFYFVSVVLVLQFIPINPGITPDRYSYLSYIGLLFIVAHLFNKIWQRKRGILASIKYPFTMLLIIGSVVFSYQAYSRTQVWKNSEVLWTDVIDNYPNGYIAYDNCALYYCDIHEEDNAMSLLNKDLQLNPSDRDAYFNRGLLYSDHYKKKDLAIADYSKTIAIDPTYKKALLNCGLLYSGDGKYDLAIFDFTKAIVADPEYAGAYTDRGIAYYNYGKKDLAMADFTKAITLDSSNAEAYSDRASLYLESGKNDLAITDFDKAIKVDPTFPLFYYNRGLGYVAIHKYSKAVNDFTSGIQLNPQDVEIYYYIRGICYDSLKNYNEAISDFSKAIGLNSSVPYYWLNRSTVENKIGQNEMAKADSLKARQLKKGNKL